MYKMIGIRADGNDIISIGHIMRCMAIGKEIQKKDEEVIFFLADDNVKDLVESRGFKTCVLNTLWNETDSEAEVFIKKLEELKVKKILLDKYEITEKYLEKIGQVADITYMDDMNMFDYPVKKLVAYNIYGDENINKYKQNFTKAEKIYCGLDYIPLREEFKEGKYRNTGKENIEIRDIFITTGGSDSYKMSWKIVNALEDYRKRFTDKKWNYHVVIGRYYTNKNDFYNKAEELDNLHLYENVTDMSGLMKKNDIAICAGGTTVFELSACGVPSLVFIIADNQKGIIGLDDLGVIKYMGNAGIDKNIVCKNIVETISYYSDNTEELLEWSKHSKSKVDGCGAERIAKIVCES